jgi:hypothetical protein
MSEPLFSPDDVAAVDLVERGSSADRTGLMVGDRILRFGRHMPSEIIAHENPMSLLGRADWMLVLRDEVFFKLAVGAGIEGAEMRRGERVEGLEPPAETENWISCHGALGRGRGIIVLPDRISPLWALVPPLLFARHHLWQFTAAIVLIYAVAGAFGFVPALLAYVTSMITVGAGGAALLRDAAGKQGWHPTARLAVASWNEAAKLEVTTAKLCFEEKIRARLEAAKAAAH